MLWTDVIRGEAGFHSPAETPAFWRRAADQEDAAACARLIGPLEREDQKTNTKDWRLEEDWDAVHARLAIAARWWRSDPGDPTLYRLAPEIEWRRNRDTRELYGVTCAMADAGQLIVHVDPISWRPMLYATTLRAFLWADCVTAFADNVTYRRCKQCQQWFTPSRSDSLFCSNHCKQTDYETRRAARSAG
jgi:hypothetical protein